MSDQDRLLKAEFSTPVKTLWSNVEQAHANGALYFLARELTTLLERDKMLSRKGITASRLQSYLLSAARAMVTDQKEQG